MKNQKKINLIIYIFLSIIGLGIIGFLAFKYIAPFGKIVSYQFSQKLPKAKEINKIAEQGESIKLSGQIIKNSLSRFSLKIDPQNIENIKVNLRFKSGQKEIKMGIRGNEKDAFLYQPLYSAILKDLSWQNIQEKSLTLWQRNKDFNSIKQFIQNPPENRKIALYLVNTKKLLSLKPIKEKNQQQTIISSPLRGNHTLYIMVTQKPLVIKIAKQDINNYDGADKLKIILSRGQTFVTEKTIADDGVTDNSRLKSLPQETEIRIEDLQPDIYKLILNFDSPGADSLITKIEINQGKVIFDKNIFFLGENPTTFYTNSRKMDVLTAHEASLQTVKLNGKDDLEIKETGKNFSFDLEKLAGKLTGNELYKLESPKNDLMIKGDGYFSFSQDSFFYPEIIKSVNLEDFSSVFDIYNDVDYILTTLPPIKQEGDWLVSEVNIDPKDINITGDTLFFSLEIPDLEKYGGSLEIDFFSVEIKNKGMLETKATPTIATTSKSASEQISPALGKKNIVDTYINVVGGFTINSFNRAKVFIANLLGKITGKTAPVSPITTTPSPKPTIILTPTRLISPTVTPKITPIPTTSSSSYSIKVSVLNGGAEKGAGGKFAQVLRNAGFTNVSANNADNFNYKNALIRYRAADKTLVDKIANLLQSDYKTIDKQETAAMSAQIIIILGSK